MFKSKWATILAAPAGAVWALDTLIVNMPRVMEGGLLVAGIGAALLGWEGCRKLIHSATADKPAEEQAPLEQSQERHPAGSQLPPADPFQLPSARAAELLQAFQMGADAAQERVKAQPASVRRLER